MSDTNSNESFILTDEQIKILEEEHHLHVTGQTKSYSREDAIQIIRDRKSIS